VDSVVFPSVNPQLASVIEQPNPANYGLARVSHRGRNFTSYRYDSTAGMGTCAYIIDSGINISKEFNDAKGMPRAFHIGNVVNTRPDDEIGHGTHVSGIFGSNSYGAAKNARIYMIKAFQILNGRETGPTDAGFMTAFDLILDTYKAERLTNCKKGIVLNLSLSDGSVNSVPGTTVLDMLTQKIIDAGIPVFVAAGNSNIPASQVSPAHLAQACTIGNSDKADDVFRGINNPPAVCGRRIGMNFGASDYGSAVKLFAPGTDILSTFKNNVPLADPCAAAIEPVYPNGTALMTGTSMASPLAAGVGAYLLGLSSSYTLKSSFALCQQMIDTSTKFALRNIALNPEFISDPLSPNRLVYNGNGA
jgi:subtilisin family serine protease